MADNAIARYDLTAREGATFTLRMTYSAITAWSGWHAQLQVRAFVGAPEAAFDWSDADAIELTDDAEGGQIELTALINTEGVQKLGAGTAKGWPSRKGVYDLKLTSPTGVVEYLMEGEFEVELSVTR